jgi:hypothetical protein
MGGGRVNGGDESEVMWFIGLIYIYEIEQWNLNCLKWVGSSSSRRDGGKRSNQCTIINPFGIGAVNPIYNECVLIKMKEHIYLWENVKE